MKLDPNAMEIAYTAYIHDEFGSAITAAIKAYIAAAGLVELKEGEVVVPEEPTDEMMERAGQLLNELGPSISVWQAMIAVRPRSDDA